MNYSQDIRLTACGGIKELDFLMTVCSYTKDCLAAYEVNSNSRRQRVGQGELRFS